MSPPDDWLSRLSDMVRARRSSLAALARAEGVTSEDAVDCVQEGLCTFLTNAQRGDIVDDVGQWSGVLAGMVRNAARNRRRRHHHARPHQPIDEDASLDPEGIGTDELISRAEDHVRLRACVEELCEIQKAVVTLRMLEEQPGEDVARALGISPNHVAVLLHRAKASLRVCLTAR